MHHHFRNRILSATLAVLLLAACGTKVVNPVSGRVERSVMDEQTEISEGRKAEDRKFKAPILAHDRPGTAPDSAGWRRFGVGCDLQSVDGAARTGFSRGFPTG